MVVACRQIIEINLCHGGDPCTSAMRIARQALLTFKQRLHRSSLRLVHGRAMCECTLQITWSYATVRGTESILANASRKRCRPHSMSVRASVRAARQGCTLCSTSDTCPSTSASTTGP